MANKLSVEVIAPDQFVYPWTDSLLALSSSLTDVYQFEDSWHRFLHGNNDGGIFGDYSIYESNVMKKLMQ